jgi:hypothetical protein
VLERDPVDALCRPEKRLLQALRFWQCRTRNATWNTLTNSVYGQRTLEALVRLNGGDCDTMNVPDPHNPHSLQDAAGLLLAQAIIM